jgi:hypothetical protein
MYLPTRLYSEGNKRQYDGRVGGGVQVAHEQLVTPPCIIIFEVQLTGIFH